MKITREIVERTANLAALRFNNIEEFVSEFERIVSFVEQVRELELEGAEPLYWLGAESCPERKDEVGLPLTREEALGTATKRIDEFFEVPRIL